MKYIRGLLLAMVLIPITALAQSAPPLVMGTTVLIQPAGAPTPTPTPTASPSTDALPYEFDELFKGGYGSGSSAGSPLLNKLVAGSGGNQYVVVQNPLSSDIWSEENFTSLQNVQTGIPIYVTPSSGTVSVTASCYTNLTGDNNYGNCGGWTQLVNIFEGNQSTTGVQVQNGSDQHMSLIDTRNGVEVDCWGVYDYNGTAHDQTMGGNLYPDLTGGTLKCNQGGTYQTGTTGIQSGWNNSGGQSGATGTALGPAEGEFMITPWELQRGQINHALVWNAVCLNSPNVYPGRNGAGTDQGCPGYTASGGNPAPNGPYPHYGDVMVYITQTDAQIAASSRSTACKAVLTAAHDYGIYFGDTGDDVTRLDVNAEEVYTADPGNNGGSDPFTAVYSDIGSHGDGNNSGQWYDCMNGLSNTDFELVEINAP